MTETSWLNFQQLLQTLGRNTRWWYRHQHRLYAEHGFPLPAPGPGHYLWPETAVLAWLARKPLPAPAERGDSVEARVLARAESAAVEARFS